MLVLVLQYAALATQIGTAARMEAPRRGTKPVSPNIGKRKRAVPVAGRAQKDDSNQVLDAPGYTSDAEEHGDDRDALAAEVDALREEVADLAARVRPLSICTAASTDLL